MGATAAPARSSGAPRAPARSAANAAWWSSAAAAAATPACTIQESSGCIADIGIDAIADVVVPCRLAHDVPAALDDPLPPAVI